MSTPDDGSVADLIERTAAALWSAHEERVSGVPWRHAGPWRQRRYQRMAQALHTIGLLVDPAIGRDLNALQRSRDKWRGRAKAAERVSALDRERANAAARESASARTDAEALQRQLDDQSEELELARDRADRLQRMLDLITTWAEDGDRIDDPGARAVLGMIRQDDET